MKSIVQITGAALIGLALAGCSDNNNSRSDSDRPDLPVDFTTFVKAEIDKTSDSREAANINDLEFSFNDQNNEQAFDELF
jgi:ABC-type oligopeptide transport system substrate-binding subunit